MVTRGGRKQGRYELGVWDQQVHTLLCIKQINNKILLYIQHRNYIQYSVTNRYGTEYGKESVCVYLNHCGIHQKLTQHCTSAILQLKRNESSPFVHIHCMCMGAGQCRGTMKGQVSLGEKSGNIRLGKRRKHQRPQ